MKNIGLLLILLSLTACGQVHDHSQNHAHDHSNATLDVEAELAAIEELRDNFELAIKEGRYEDIGQYVTPDVITVGPGSADWEKMRKLGQDRGRFPYDSIVMHPTETAIINDTMAYDWGYSTVYYTDEEGNSVKLQDSFLVLLKKIDGEWKLFREIGSSQVNE